MLEKPLGGRGILLGGVPGVAAANVMVIGGGAVGMNAAFIAIGMEADVFVYDSVDRQAARARRRVRRPRLDRLQLDALDRGGAARHGPRDRRRARPRRPRAARDQPRAARPDEAQRRARRRRDRPGRLLRDLEADHPLRPDLRGRRDHPLLRREHARRGADHLDLRAHQRDPSLRALARRQRRRRGARRARPGPAARDQRRRRQGHAPGGGRGRRARVRSARAVLARHPRRLRTPTASIEQTASPSKIAATKEKR